MRRLYLLHGPREPFADGSTKVLRTTLRNYNFPVTRRDHRRALVHLLTGNHIFRCPGGGSARRVSAGCAGMRWRLQSTRCSSARRILTPSSAARCSWELQWALVLPSLLALCPTGTLSGYYDALCGTGTWWFPPPSSFMMSANGGTVCSRPSPRLALSTLRSISVSLSLSLPPRLPPSSSDSFLSILSRSPLSSRFLSSLSPFSYLVCSPRVLFFCPC
ncbi:hypothetical protein BDV98DRAFT_577917 [Pterulicium gracile]|uniref:Uncharacterized protein n=1 Tax=Pterulicium gracile TaxID=1884261 RepID=A0A5C3PZN8_9AGAR|nr:hypothetical protein BDV98DRAFT_577917 [Pterula gracilis]